MTSRNVRLTAVALVATFTSMAQAQKAPAIRSLGPTLARSTESLANVTTVRQLPKGVLVNDPQRRRVLLFDSTLTSFTVVADSTSATANAFSGRTAGLIPYRGDSTLFVDPTSLSMLVIDPAGRVGRVMSVPRSQDAMMLASGVAFGLPGFDASGRLVYRGNFRPQMPPMGPNGPTAAPQMPDSAPIVRIDLATRVLDTVAFIKTPKVKMDMTRSEDGRISISTQVNPLPTVDDWAVLSNGTVVVVRGHDYHADIFADGKRTAATKMPFEWQRLSDEDKVAFIDSVKAARERMLAAQAAGGTTVPGGGVAVTGGGAGGQVTSQVMVFGGPDGGGPPARGGAAGAAGGLGPMRGQVNFVEPSELPDYKPPFFAGSMRADTDGNLWIRTIPTKAIVGGPIYDVVNSKGELVDRVQIPAGRTIVGFGAGGIVYLSARDKDMNYLERARIR